MRAPGIALLIAGALSTASTPALSAAPQGMCNTIAKMALTKILKAGGVSNEQIFIGDATYKTVDAYFANPGDSQLNEAAKALAEVTVKKVFPGSAVVITGGKLTLSGVRWTIDEAQRLKVEAFLCGNRSFFEPVTPSFFQERRVQELTGGADCNDFTNHISTFDQLAALKSFWNGYYSDQVRMVRGNDAETRERLAAGWMLLEQRWAERWAEKEMVRMHAALRREVEELPPECADQPKEPVVSGDYAAWMTGTFETGWGRMTLSNGSGNYEHDGGTVTVTSVDGPTVKGTWRQTSAGSCPDGGHWGGFSFTFTPSGFSGDWGHCGGKLNQGGWSGVRRQ